ncbi:hypothetical protein M9H77_12414 [Catharanthus roseus]|uniref:Uncharacterized protein n=1 Tax=Catharanthus roseus TaxID=4058 RepID=A0ACC0BHA5_CATRO|nr:hypothetical protein M9H77_12414 [Catharanthus roseus]
MSMLYLFRLESSVKFLFMLSCKVADDEVHHMATVLQVLYFENLEDSEVNVVLDYPMRNWGDSSIQCDEGRGREGEEGGEGKYLPKNFSANESSGCNKLER